LFGAFFVSFFAILAGSVLNNLHLINKRIEMTTTEEKYFELCYSKRIHEFSKIDAEKGWQSGEAKERYKSLNNYYIEQIGIDKERLDELRERFKKFNDLYTNYFNEDRRTMFQDYNGFMDWYEKQKDCCHYCEITKTELSKIVERRGGNLTLNGKTKRSKGTLEIEKLEPNKGYTFLNTVLACPFCNNAKSNLISEKDWKCYFKPVMKKYLQSQLK